MGLPRFEALDEGLREFGTLAFLFVLEIYESTIPIGPALHDGIGPPSDIRFLVAFVAETKVPVVSGGYERGRTLLAVGYAQGKVPPLQQRKHILC